ncbi:MAG: L-lactate dehydrogenase [Oscillospiraceae bacterium]|jgi:L-lactate dehydrogenase|nr:L-lactate dehydrogenase [Oscillospiraceae bacterium]
MNPGINNRKVGIIGCGFVGSSSAFALMQSDIFSEIVLVDVDRDKAEGEAMDIAHGAPYGSSVKVTAGNYDDIADAAVIVITAGAARKPGETRLDLVNKNVHIFQGIIPEIKKRNYQGVLVIVANPVDILTRVAMEMSGLPAERVIGTGTMLDSSRLKAELGHFLQVNPRSVHAFVIGEHGDSEIAALSSANISGVPLNSFCEMRSIMNYQESMNKIAEDVKHVGAEIIKKKHATYYGVSMSVKRLCRAIVMDEQCVLPVSNVVHGRYGIDHAVLSVPCIIGKSGVEGNVPIALSLSEEHMLQESAKTLNELWAKVKLD